MRKKILAFVFAAAVLVAMAVPLFGGGTALAANNAVTVSNPGGSHCRIVDHNAGAGGRGVNTAAPKVSASHGQSSVTMDVVHAGSCP